MFSLSLKMLGRDWRAGELRFLLLALIVAVASSSSVGFFVDRLRSGLDRDAHQMLAADLLLTSTKPIEEEWKVAARSRQLQIAETVVFPSMALVGDPEHSRAKLVGLKAVDAHYPLRGRLKLSEHGQEVPTNQTPQGTEAWVDPTLLTALQIQIGDSINLGERVFKVTQEIANEPDAGSNFFGFAPRVMIAQDALVGTGLIQDGSRATYRLLLAGEKEKINQFKEFLSGEIKQRELKYLRLESLESNNEQMRSTLDRASQFLAMVSMLSTLLAAIAVAMAARRFMLRHIDACAMLRCLGLTQNQVTGLFAFEFLVLALLASVIGVAFGFASHFLLLAWARDLISTSLPPASMLPAWQGLLVGVLLLMGFAMPPILQLRNVPHNRVIRREQDAPKALTLSTYVFGLGMFTTLLLWQAGDLRLGLMIALGFLLGLLVFAGCAWLAMFSLNRLRGLIQHPAWRFALTSLQRRPSASIAQIVALSLGLMALLLLTVVRADLIKTWQQSIPADAPNHFIFNIQPDQAARISEQLVAFGKPQLYPMIRGRLIGLNEVAIDASRYQDAQAKAMIEREFNLSSMAELPTLNTVSAGNWFGDVSAEQAEASVEEGLAKTLQLKLGDRLRFDIAGQIVTAKITSLRKLDWGSMRVNFFVIISPRAMQGMPQTFITAFHLPKAQTQFSNRLSLDYPNLTIMDVGAMVKQLQNVLNQVITAVEFLFAFSLVAGVLVLYAALAGSQDVRMRESALLRALGATRRQLSHAQWVEFALVGSLAGILAATGASAIAWVLATYVFKFAWVFSSLVWLVGAAVGVACALIGGWLGLREVLNQAPLLSLRNT